jgi:hypothetical protein
MYWVSIALVVPNYEHDQTFDTTEDLRRAVLAFRETSNATWLIERHGSSRQQPSGRTASTRGARRTSSNWMSQ